MVAVHVQWVSVCCIGTRRNTYIMQTHDCKCLHEIETWTSENIKHENKIKVVNRHGTGPREHGSNNKTHTYSRTGRSAQRQNRTEIIKVIRAKVFAKIHFVIWTLFTKSMNHGYLINWRWFPVLYPTPVSARCFFLYLLIPLENIGMYGDSFDKQVISWRDHAHCSMHE